jgi:hypothetical protein
MHPDGRESYLRSSLFFCLFFVGHDRENKDAREGEGQVPNRFDTLRLNNLQSSRPSFLDGRDAHPTVSRRARFLIYQENLGLKSRHKLDGFLKVLRHLTVKIRGQCW